MTQRLTKLKEPFLNIPIHYFALIVSFLNLILFHFPIIKFVVGNVDSRSFNVAVILISLIILVFAANALVFYLLCYISRYFGKTILSLFFILNAISLYFINTYGVMIDETMMSNVINTNFNEAFSFFSFKFVVYVVVFGLLPSIYMIVARLRSVKFKQFIITFSATLLFSLIVLTINIGNIAWIHRHSEPLGSLLLPWSYTVNTARYYVHKYKQNRKEILLPDATIKNDEKAVLVLVIGESARRKNFSLYGYAKNTNPLLSATERLYHFDANSVATYTIAGVKAILEYEKTSKMYEPLPNYLQRTGIEVVWRTNNTGEPSTISVEKYQNADYLKQICAGDECGFDGMLLSGLKEQILESQKDKVFIVLHTSTSHGPDYFNKYPKHFEHFTPVCNRVELEKCSQEELYNAYDNTIVYTDYILYSVIKELNQLTDYKSTMIFVSDHGESLGENNLYMHGADMSFAPAEQYEIPFIVWVSDSNTKLKNIGTLSQHHVFHSVLKFLSIDSPVYKEEMNIFE